MRTTTIALAAGLLLAFAIPAHADKCRTLKDKQFPVKVQACSADDGTGGYYEVTNRSKQPADMCWEIVFRNGSRTQGCQRGAASQEALRFTCDACGEKGKGVLFAHTKSFKAWEAAAPAAP